MAPSVGLRSRGVWLLWVSWSSQLAMQCARMIETSQLLLASQPREGYFQGCLSSCWNCFTDSSCFSPVWHWLPAFAFGWWKWKCASDTSWWAPGLVSPPVCMWATFPLCCFGIFPVGSDVRLPSKAVCVGEALFGTPYESSSWRICDGSVFWYVCIPSVWLISLLPFCRMGNSGSVPPHSPLGHILGDGKDFSYDPMTKERKLLLTLCGHSIL